MCIRDRTTAETLGLSTVEEVYERVIIDLKESINILEELESAGIGLSLIHI